MMGMGIPSRYNKIERMDGLLTRRMREVGHDETCWRIKAAAGLFLTQASRCRPPQVAAKLEAKAPISNEANNHKAA